MNISLYYAAHKVLDYSSLFKLNVFFNLIKKIFVCSLTTHSKFRKLISTRAKSEASLRLLESYFGGQKEFEDHILN